MGKVPQEKEKQNLKTSQENGSQHDVDPGKLCRTRGPFLFVFFTAKPPPSLPEVSMSLIWVAYLGNREIEGSALEPVFGLLISQEGPCMEKQNKTLTPSAISGLRESPVQKLVVFFAFLRCADEPSAEMLGENAFGPIIL